MRVPRVATVRLRPEAEPPSATGTDEPGARLALALLLASPRVSVADPRGCRVDARGWGRRGGEAALARRILEITDEEGVGPVRVGIADTPVAADAAALIATLPGPPRAEGRAVTGGEPGLPGCLLVPPGEDRAFLAPLPLDLLPLSPDLLDTLRAAGLRRIGELAARPIAELEARFGPEGVRAGRRARGEDDRPFRTLRVEEPPEASLELGRGVEALEPLLFALRRLLAHVGAGLRETGSCAAELLLRLEPEDGPPREWTFGPARPTAREEVLFDLCRAALEAGVVGGGLPGAVLGLSLRVRRTAPAGARQGDLFEGGWRDPLAASGALSRLRARLGEGAVAVPDPRRTHRPEGRNAWRPADEEASRSGSPAHGKPRPGRGGAPRRRAGRAEDEGLPPVLRLLPRPRRVRVRTRAGRPAVLRDGEGVHEIRIAEGPERLSGGWWERPYRREYFRLGTAGGELLWVFRESRPGGEDAWWLHGWWD